MPGASVPSGPRPRRGPGARPLTTRATRASYFGGNPRQWLYHAWIHACSEKKLGTRGSAGAAADQNVLSYEILHAVKRDGALVYSLGPWWSYRSWRRHGNAPACCSTGARRRRRTASRRRSTSTAASRRDYVKRTGSARTSSAAAPTRDDGEYDRVGDLLETRTRTVAAWR